MTRGGPLIDSETTRIRAKTTFRTADTLCVLATHVTGSERACRRREITDALQTKFCIARSANEGRACFSRPHVQAQQITLATWYEACFLRDLLRRKQTLEKFQYEKRAIQRTFCLRDRKNSNFSWLSLLTSVAAPFGLFVSAVSIGRVRRRLHPTGGYSCTLIRG